MSMQITPTQHVTRQTASGRATGLYIYLATLAIIFLTGSVAFSQNDEDLPLYERDPFDRLLLNKANDFAIVDVYTIQTIDRLQPLGDISKQSFEIRRLEDPPSQMYSVNGRHILKLQRFADLLLSEAQQLVKERKVDAAFPYLSRLIEDYPQTPGMQDLTEAFFFADARELFRERRYDESLHSLDEVYKRNPKRPGLDRGLQYILAEIIRDEFKSGNYESVRRKTAYAKERYGAVAQNTVKQWETKLQAEAGKQLEIARRAFSTGNARTALVASRRAQKIWPELEGVATLNRQILAKFPRIRVGVSQRFVPQSNVAPLLDWGTRRARALVQRDLVEFREFTADGGQYASSLGKFDIDPNRRQINFTLNSSQPGEEAFDIARMLLLLGDKRQPNHDVRWAEFLKSIYVPNPKQLEVHLTRRTLRPETLLPVFSASVGQKLGPGPFMALASSDDEQELQTYQARSSAQSTNGVREIIEEMFEDPADATNALLAGNLDVIDRVYPPDLAKLRSRPNVQVVQYRLPTVHFLVFNDREPLLRSSTYRRGLLYGLNRAEFVRSDLIAGGSADTAQVLTGPLPIGTSAADPLGYAYNKRILPRDYDPALSLVLLRLAQAQQALSGVEKREAETTIAAVDSDQNVDPDADPDAETDIDIHQQEPFPALTLAHPASPMARIASAAISTDLARIGVAVTTRELPPGQSKPDDADWDMLYVETTIEEPFVDIPELVLGQSILGRHGGLVWQAVRALQESANLEEARNQFGRVHKLAFDHTPLLPLWQIVEHAAFRKGIQGIPDTPVSLYKNVSEWGIAP